MGLVAVWWGMLQNRIRKAEKVADDAVTSDEFMGYVSRADKRMDDLRTDIRQIFDIARAHDNDDRKRHDDIVQMMHNDHKEVLEYLLRDKQ